MLLGETASPGGYGRATTGRKALGPLAISLILLASGAAFVALAWLKLGILVRLQPEGRFDHPWQRISKVLRLGLFQERMIENERRAGWMHVVIFVGFMTLLVRKIQLFAIGYNAGFVYPGTLGSVYAGFKDGIEIAVTLAVLYALWRRLLLKPARLERNREALLVLGLILSIMLTDFLFDGFRFAVLAGSDAAIAHERSAAFAGGAIADQLERLSPAALELGYRAFYWIQILLVCGFLVLLPVGEHFHIVTALPTLYFSRKTPLRKVPTVDLDRLMADEGDAEVKVGAATAADLSWKDGLDVFTCTECGRCKTSCPTFLTGKPLSLKWVNDSLKHHLLEQRGPLLARKFDTLPVLIGPVISPDTLWACTTCGYCEHACPIELEHLGKFFRLRQHQVMMEGQFPAELRTVFDGYESQSNPWGLPADTRGDWAQGLGVAVLTSPEQARELDYLFYVGSPQSFDKRNQKVARAFVKILQAAGVRFAILGAREGSTGECVRRAGNEMLFQTLAYGLRDSLNELGVTRIVTCDPHAFNSLKNEYPEFGGHYEVVHHSQLIAELIAAGRIRPERRFERVIFHDPCYLGRHNGEYEAPRAAVAAVTRDAPLEFPLARDQAMCCGAGGGRFWMEEHLGRRINLTRLEQALPQSPATIATACPYCATMMGDAIAGLGQGEAIRQSDIAELVAAALPEPAPSPAQ